jgi:hypothetical protein
MIAANLEGFGPLDNSFVIVSYAVCFNVIDDVLRCEELNVLCSPPGILVEEGLLDLLVL